MAARVRVRRRWAGVVTLTEGPPTDRTKERAAGPRHLARGVFGKLGLLGFLVIALVAAMLFAAGRGQLDIPASEVLGSVMHRLGLDWGSMPSHPQGDNTLWQVRFPRVVTAVLAGAALATAG